MIIKPCVGLPPRWAATHNELLSAEFGVRRALPAVFIDTFHTNASAAERQKFEENAAKLWRFAAGRQPFECKGIRRALTEIRGLFVQIGLPESTHKYVFGTTKSVCLRPVRFSCRPVRSLLERLGCQD